MLPARHCWILKNNVSVSSSVVKLLPEICFSFKTLLYCSNDPNMRAVVALFCMRGGRIPRYRLSIPSALSCEAASQAEIPCSCCLNMVLLTGKVREMLMMPLPQPAAYSLHSPAGPATSSGQSLCSLLVGTNLKDISFPRNILSSWRTSNYL